MSIGIPSPSENRFVVTNERECTLTRLENEVRQIILHDI